MNKSELVHAIADEAEVKLVDAEKCLNAFTKVVTKSLKKNKVLRS